MEPDLSFQRPYHTHVLSLPLVYLCYCEHMIVNFAHFYAPMRRLKFCRPPAPFYKPHSTFAHKSGMSLLAPIAHHLQTLMTHLLLLLGNVAYSYQSTGPLL